MASLVNQLQQARLAIRRLFLRYSSSVSFEPEHIHCLAKVYFLTTFFNIQRLVENSKHFWAIRARITRSRWRGQRGVVRTEKIVEMSGGCRTSDIIVASSHSCRSQLRARGQPRPRPRSGRCSPRRWGWWCVYPRSCHAWHVTRVTAAVIICQQVPSHHSRILTRAQTMFRLVILSSFRKFLKQIHHKWTNSKINRVP